MADTKMTGIVESFDNAKGYGYIKTEDYPERLLVHYASIVNDRYRMLRKGDRVEFVLNETPSGPRATEVEKK